MNNNNRQNRRPMTREEAILAEKRRAEAARKRKEAKEMTDKIVAVSIFALIGAALSLIVIFSYIFIDFNHSGRTPDEPVKITYQKENTVVLGKDFYTYKNGEYYVSLTKVCEVCSFTLHGNSKNMTLTLPDGKSASFDTGTPSVRIENTYSVLKKPTFFYSGHLFIPVSFFEDKCHGITCEFDKMGKTHGFNLIFDKDFSFKALTTNESGAILYDGTSSSEEDRQNMFKSDLSDYETYMNPENKDEFLFLIDSSNKLGKDYIPDDLIEISDTRSDREKQKMRLYAAKALEALFIEMRSNGFDNMRVISGYRSYDYQASLLENETYAFLPEFDGDRSQAESKALTRVQIPGSSEHQSGLCVDMSTSAVLSEALGEEAVYKWLYSNCANFGFILRYPKDKTSVTGVSFEPWHFRYVGRYHAQKIMNEGLCLEEYMSVNR